MFVWLVSVRQTGAASALMCPANGIIASKQDLPLMRYAGTLNMRARMSQTRKLISLKHIASKISDDWLFTETLLTEQNKSKEG